ncbi:hypothetical protein HXX76_008730 [Chlamydomonas incerta]|uniref:Uncharacterized protein n=1 Tax=Chlamydomonas incerta TaxID=51695 RepID=A0A835W0T0_CHLIN|nr:hypothetical protein HXX76_008730 [Chlamydomonas incerta]|eukprot:KAG2433003.1 hypothetical protein HXX76_008730 [Chlamydomonas incerta]
MWARVMSLRKNASAGPQPLPQLQLTSLLREALASLAASAGFATRPAAAGACASLHASRSSSFSLSLNGLPRQSFDAGPQDAEPHTPRATEAAHRSCSEQVELDEDAIGAVVAGRMPRSQRLPREGLLRRRFSAQVRRGVLRIRIAGADPDQLPAEWRELVAAHFTGEGVVPGWWQSLVTAVAVRRGSIYLTVSLVEAPMPADGGEGAGGGGTGAAAETAAEATAAPAAPAAAAHAGPTAPSQLSCWDRVIRDATMVSSGTDVAATVSFENGMRDELAPPPPPPSQPSTAASSSAGGFFQRMAGVEVASSVQLAAAQAAGHSVPGRERPSPPGGRLRLIRRGGSSLSTASSSAAAAAAAAAVQAGGPGPSQPFPLGPRRRVAGGWRHERQHAAVAYTQGTSSATSNCLSPLSTPGNSNIPLQALCQPGSAGLYSHAAANGAAAGLARHAPSLPGAAGLGICAGASRSTSGNGGTPQQHQQQLHPGQHQPPMRYTSMLSPAQQAVVCGGNLYSIGAGLMSQSFEVQAPSLPLRRGSMTTAGSTTRTGSVGAAAMQVAQLLDAMQLRSREVGTEGASHWGTTAGLSAVSQMDGGLPVQLRQVLCSASWEVDEGITGSWEPEGLGQMYHDRPGAAAAHAHQLLVQQLAQAHVATAAVAGSVPPPLQLGGGAGAGGAGIHWSSHPAALSGTSTTLGLVADQRAGQPLQGAPGGAAGAAGPSGAASGHGPAELARLVAMARSNSDPRGAVVPGAPGSAAGAGAGAAVGSSGAATAAAIGAGLGAASAAEEAAHRALLALLTPQQLAELAQLRQLARLQAYVAPAPPALPQSLQLQPQPQPQLQPQAARPGASAVQTAALVQGHAQARMRPPAALPQLMEAVPPAAAARPVYPATGLAVRADPASLPVQDVAVSPVLVCKAPLLFAVAAGSLAASVPPRVPAAPASAASAATGAPARAAGDSDVVAASRGRSDSMGGASRRVAAAVRAASAAAPAPGPASAAAQPPGAAAPAAAGPAGAAAPAEALAAGSAPLSEFSLSLVCTPGTVAELSVMLRYCGPASVFGEQAYLPVQLQLDSSSPAVAAAIRLQAAAAERERGGGDTQAARDVAEEDVAQPLPARATVRTPLADLACPGVLYVELWHGPQLCACLPVLLLPEAAASWAHEVCSLWQQQAEEGEAAAALSANGGGAAGRAGAAAVSAAAHQVVEDLGGWLTYAAHRRYVAERAAAAARAMATAAAATAAHQTGMPAGAEQAHARMNAVAGLRQVTQVLTDAQLPDGSGSGGRAGTGAASAWNWQPAAPPPAQVVAAQPQLQLTPVSPAAVAAQMADAAPAATAQPTSLALSSQSSWALSGTSMVLPGLRGPPAAPDAAVSSSGGPDHAPAPDMGAAAASMSSGTGGVMLGDDMGADMGADLGGGMCDRELFHDMMLQEGYNWLADCVEAGCCGLANALLQSLVAAGCSAAEVVRTCRSADGLPLPHAALLSPNPAMPDLVWQWGLAAGVDMGPRPGRPAAPAAEAATAAAAQSALMAAAPAAASTSASGALGSGASGGAGAAVSRAASSSGLASYASGFARVSVSSGPGSAARPAPQRSAQPAAAVALGAVAMVLHPGSRAPSRSLSRLSVVTGEAAPSEAAPSPRPSWAGIVSAQAHAQAPTRPPAFGTSAAAPRLAAPTWAALLGRSAPAALQAALAGAAEAGRAAGAGAIAPLLAPAAGWLLRLLRRAGMAALHGGDRAVAALHAGLLRANPFYDSSRGGVVEEHFVWFFQQGHGWVFSAWCWSMIPIYVITAARFLHEGQWVDLALTPLWLWLYALCAAMDVAGATAAYRVRTEALAAAMHVSHTIAKALACAGLPAYPIPPGSPSRLYWSDVLACATLSALCEPVRIYVALPARIINCTVSTVLYRHAGAAPSYLEALLLSMSCHGLGLLLQHTVESHYRRTFRASGAHAAATAAATARAAAAALDAPPTADSHDAVAALRARPAAAAAAVAAAVAAASKAATAEGSGSEAAKPDETAPAGGAAAAVSAVAAATATVSSVSAREYVSPLRALHRAGNGGGGGLLLEGAAGEQDDDEEEDDDDDDGDMARSVPALSADLPSLLASVSEATAAAMAWPGPLGPAPGTGGAEGLVAGGPWPGTPGPGSERQQRVPPSTSVSHAHREVVSVQPVGLAGMDGEASARVPVPPGAMSARASMDSSAVVVASIASAVGARSAGPEALAVLAAGMVQQQQQQQQPLSRLLQQQQEQGAALPPVALAAQPAGMDALPSAGAHHLPRARPPAGPSALAYPATSGAPPLDGGRLHIAAPPASARVMDATRLLHPHPNSDGTPQSHMLLSHGSGFEGLLPSLPGWGSGLPGGTNGLPLEESPPGGPWGSSIDSASPAKGAVSASSRSTAAWPSSAGLLLQSLGHASSQLLSVPLTGAAAGAAAGAGAAAQAPGQPRLWAAQEAGELPHQQQQQQQQQPGVGLQLGQSAQEAGLPLRPEAVGPADDKQQTAEDSAALDARLLVTVGSVLAASTAVHANSLGHRSSNSNSGSAGWRGVFPSPTHAPVANGGSRDALPTAHSRGTVAAVASAGLAAGAGGSGGSNSGSGSGSQERLAEARPPTLAGYNDSGAAGPLAVQAQDREKAALTRLGGSAPDAALPPLLTMSATVNGTGTGTGTGAGGGTSLSTATCTGAEQERRSSGTSSGRLLASAGASACAAPAVPTSACRSSGGGSSTLQAASGGTGGAGNGHSGSVKAAAKRLASKVLTALRIKSKKKKAAAPASEVGRE